MTELSVSADKLSKAYRIGLKQERHDTFTRAFLSWMRAPARNWTRLRRLGRFDDQEDAGDVIWALRDIDLEVRRGDVLGIIGRNGAGKSTLLKLLSRITEPTYGRAELHGRVSSLLEVGTGFHPELTGRENVFMNGTILGMTKREIDRKFDEIVAFAGVEKFIDTPVKRYSSGMRVRLAFSVAAHLDAEVLIIDEVLAVGDISFQRKCLGHMEGIARGGRTVLFVSHDIGAVRSICSECMLLEAGRVLRRGPTSGVLDTYLRSCQSVVRAVIDLQGHEGRRRESLPLMSRVTLCDDAGDPVSSFPMGGELACRVDYRVETPLSPVLGLVVRSGLGSPVLCLDNRFIGGFEFPSQSGEATITCRITNLPLMPGNYEIDLYLGDRQHSIDVIAGAVRFDVVEADVFGTGKIPPAHAARVFHNATWETGSVR